MENKKNYGDKKRRMYYMSYKYTKIDRENYVRITRWRTNAVNLITTTIARHRHVRRVHYVRSFAYTVISSGRFVDRQLLYLRYNNNNISVSLADLAHHRSPCWERSRGYIIRLLFDCVLFTVTRIASSYTYMYQAYIEVLYMYL